MSRLIMHKIIAVTAASLLLFIVSACSDDAEQPATNTTGTESQEPDEQDAADPASLSARLAEAIKATTGLAVRGQARVEGIGDETVGPLAINFTIDADGDTETLIETAESDAPTALLREVDNQLYSGFSGPAVSALFPNFSGETAWLTIPEEHAEEFQFVCASPLIALSSNTGECDPEADLQVLAEAVQDETVIGNEDLRGVDTTHYQYTIPLANLSSLPSLQTGASPGSETEATDDGAEETLGSMLDGSITLNVWIDNESRLRKVDLDLAPIFAGFAELFGEAGTPEGTVDEDTTDLPALRTIIEYHEFDDSISVEAPSAESIVGDYADLAEAGAL